MVCLTQGHQAQVFWIRYGWCCQIVNLDLAMLTSLSGYLRAWDHAFTVGSYSLGISLEAIEVIVGSLVKSREVFDGEMS